MKYTTITDPIVLTITSVSAACAFICSYFMQLYMDNQDQYIAVIGVMFLDGIFGMIAGTKREGFKTRRALDILKNTAAWIMILSAVLMIERGFAGTG